MKGPPKRHLMSTVSKINTGTSILFFHEKRMTFSKLKKHNTLTKKILKILNISTLTTLSTAVNVFVSDSFSYYSLSFDIIFIILSAECREVKQETFPPQVGLLKHHRLLQDQQQAQLSMQLRKLRPRNNQTMTILSTIASSMRKMLANSGRLSTKKEKPTLYSQFSSEIQGKQNLNSKRGARRKL